MLIVGVAVLASLVVFLVMRFPQLRRPQFRQSGAFSMPVSAACAVGVFALLWLASRIQD